MTALIGMMTVLFGIFLHFPQSVSNKVLHGPDKTAGGGAIAGRVVSVPAKAYKQAFRATLKLGQCPLVFENNNIKTCTSEFTGDEMFIPKGSMTVDVTRVQNSEDILLHVMGGVGMSIGVLGIISVSPKVNVAVTTETKKENLNFVSSYEVMTGVLSLHTPKPKTVIPENGSLFLSEIEIGGKELILVTLEFESVKQKTEVDVSVTIKILFVSITAKLNYIHNTLKAKAKVRIQFKSSWRKELDESFSSLASAIPRVEQIEAMYMKGPQELKGLSNDDERTHNLYHFSSWNQSPYGSNFNMALINHDLDFLFEQNTEIKSVLNRIGVLNKKLLSKDIRDQMLQLNQTLTEKVSMLTEGLDSYHKLNADDRQKLRDVYGIGKAPLYYTRKLNIIVEQ